jgi:hypothetical protein
MASHAQGSSESIDPAIVIAIFLVALIMSFTFFSSFYVGVWISVKKLELFLLSPFHFIFSDESVKLLEYYREAFNDPNKVATLDLGNVLNIESRLLRMYSWIYPVILIFVGLKTIFVTKGKYNKPHTMESLLEQETKTIWRFNRHLVKYNPLNETLDITQGIYSIRQKELRFCTDNDILFKEDEEDEFYNFNRSVAEDIFNNQMGLVYKGATSLKDEESWLMASFLLYLDSKKDDAFDMLGDASFVYADQMDRAYANNKARTIIEKYNKSKQLRQAEKQHAYVYTVLMRLFFEAKDMGEFSAAKFTWLKLYNRTLWYALLDVGMTDTGSIEAAGPETHYQAEFAFQRYHVVPKTKQYVDYLQDKMREYTEKQD